MEKIKLEGVPETMLQTLWARAQETKNKGRIRDPMAVEMAEKLDYDFSKAEQDKTMAAGVIARTILLDRLTGEWLDRHPGAVVINLACGLDTRCCRMAGRYARWYNLDLPETMAVRRRFLREEGPVYQIAASAMEPGWTEAVAETGEPVLVIIEGLTMYLDEQAVQQIFRILDSRFERCTVFAETMSPWVARHIKEKSIEGSQARFIWGISGGKQLEMLVPPFRSREDRSLAEGMAVLVPGYRLLAKLPPVRKISNQILVLEK